MKEGHFKRSRYAKVMGWEAFQKLDQLCQERQTLPDYAMIPTSRYFSATKPSNLLTAVIVWYLKAKGHFAARQSSTGVPRKIKGKTVFTPAPGMKGAADIYSLVNGTTLWIEVKIKDRQSEAQRKFQANIEASGGVYILVRTFDSFLEQYEFLKAE